MTQRIGPGIIKVMGIRGVTDADRIENYEERALQNKWEIALPR